MPISNLSALKTRSKPALNLPSLRATLLADSLACFGLGLGLMLGATTLAPLLTDWPSLLGYPLADCLRGLGCMVLALGAGVWAVARARQIVPLGVWAIIAVEVVWILAGIWLLNQQALTDTGVAFVLLTLIGAAGFMGLELRGVRSLANR